MKNIIFKLSKKQQIEILNERGFFSMGNLEKKALLKELGFFELEMQERIEFLEGIGVFDLDVNYDPDDIPLKLEDIDYLKQEAQNNEKNIHANNWNKNFTDHQLRSGQLQIKKVKGYENVGNLKTGAIIVCNHFNPLDTFSIEKALTDAATLRNAGVTNAKETDKKVWKVIREGNYTNPPGKTFGLYFKYSNTLPLSSVPETMNKFNEALTEILQQRKDLVIVCGEQAMWSDYRKPRPTKFGAFKWATDNNVPVIPVFITRDDTEKQEYTINFGEIIEPEKGLGVRESTILMRNKYFEFAKRTYEETYGTKLTYSTMKHSGLKEYVTSVPEFDNLLECDKKDLDFEK